jgi:carboxypeptidase Taq
MTSPLDTFLFKFRTLHDLQSGQQILEWDQQVMMPKQGIEQRSHELAALAQVVHEKLTDPELGELIQSLEEHPDLVPERRADLREARRSYERALKIPSTLVGKRTRSCALAQAAWEEAKHKNDFSIFRPHLERVLHLTREMARSLDDEHPYDALLDEFEPAMTEQALTSLFADLRIRLVKLLERIQGSTRRPDQRVLQRFFPKTAQEAFSRKVLDDMGYDLKAGRFDESAHPFTNGTFRDVRITTRYDEHFLSQALFGTIHEAGHALYEQGLSADRYRDPSGMYCSLSIHESQSRFWENLIGRSRSFWAHYYPLLQQTFAGVLDDVSLEGFYGAINVCEPSLIRVEADEITYNLHILLRFELESALISGALKVEDLPVAWNEKMGKLFGVTPRTDAEGVLQDVHWSVGVFGYFPTYTLGNLYSAQFMKTLRQDLPDLDTRVARGELAPIREWLNTRVHQHGRLYLPDELCKRVTGETLSSEAALSYLEVKYSELYF